MLARPSDGEAPCVGCGMRLDALRAPWSVTLEDDVRPRPACSERCCDEFVRGLRPPREVPPRHSVVSVEPPIRAARVYGWTGAHAVLEAERVPPPTVAFVLAIAGLIAAGFATSLSVAAISCVFTVASAGAALVAGAELRKVAGTLGYAAAPVAAILAAGSAVGYAAMGDDPRLPLVGATIVAMLANVRWWVDAHSAASVGQLEAQVRARLPASLRGSEARVGEVQTLVAGEIIPFDGVVTVGAAMVVLHPTMTVAARVGPGRPILAGARIVDGTLSVRASHVGDDRALLRALSFGDGTAADGARITRWSAVTLRWAAPAISGLVLVGFALVPNAPALAQRVAAVAAVLAAVPTVAIVRAASSCFRAVALAAAWRGVTYASAATLERAGRVGAAVFMGRGTLTVGHAEVVEAHAVKGEHIDELARIAAALQLGAFGERLPPTAAALVAYAGPAEALPSVRRVVDEASRGVRGVGPNGELIAVGQRQFLLEVGVSVASLEAEAQQAEARGLSTVFVAIDGRARGWFALRDDVRPGARAAVQRLIDLELDVQVMSGDQRATVEALARDVDVERAKAELLPSERGDEVKRLRDTGVRVAVIGRPEGDGEALAQADVPVSLAAAGSQRGERGISIATDDLEDASAGLWMARAAVSEAVRGLIIAGGAGGFLVLLGAFGLLAPGIVAVLALFVDLAVLPAPSRVLARIDRRLPGRG